MAEQFEQEIRSTNQLVSHSPEEGRAAELALARIRQGQRNIVADQDTMEWFRRNCAEGNAGYSETF